MEIGNNIDLSIDKEGIMTIKVDLNARGSPSSSGKSILVASSGGWRMFDNGKFSNYSLNFMVNKK